MMTVTVNELEKLQKRYLISRNIYKIFAGQTVVYL